MTNKSNNGTHKTAPQRHAEQVATVRELLALIENGLDVKNPHWGHVGDLDGVIENLTHAAAQAGQLTPAQVQARGFDY